MPRCIKKRLTIAAEYGFLSVPTKPSCVGVMADEFPLRLDWPQIGQPGCLSPDKPETPITVRPAVLCGANSMTFDPNRWKIVQDMNVLFRNLQARPLLFLYASEISTTEELCALRTRLFCAWEKKQRDLGGE